MNRNTKILLSGIITGAVAVQLLNMIFSGQPFRIGGELFIPVLVILIRHTVLKIADIFAEIKDELKTEVHKMRNNNKPMKNQTIRLKWVVRRKQKTADGKTVYLKKRGCKFE